MELTRRMYWKCDSGDGDKYDFIYSMISHAYTTQSSHDENDFTNCGFGSSLLSISNDFRLSVIVSIWQLGNMC